MTTAQQNASTLLTVIDDMVRDKTFSLEAVQAIQLLRNKAAEMEIKLNDAIDREMRLNQRIKDQNDRWESDQVELTALQREVFIAKEQESKISDLEKRVAVAEAIASTMRESMALIFKPLQIHQRIFEEITSDGSYNNGGANRGHVIRSAEEESQE